VLLLRNKAVSYQLLAFSQAIVARTSRFRWPLHVAVQLGLYLHPSADGARRIVSEDSGIGHCTLQIALHVAIADPVFPADCLHLSDCHRRLANS
jgi:hypothetical protein